MARLCKHGTEIGRIESLTCTTAYMSNGQVLINRGFGWKEFRKVKAGLDVKQVYSDAAAAAATKNANRPAYAAYKTALHDTAGLSHRWKLHMAIESNPQDPDGVWSDACDGYGDNCSASIEEVVELCHLYLAAQGEK